MSKTEKNKSTTTKKTLNKTKQYVSVVTITKVKDEYSDEHETFIPVAEESIFVFSKEEDAYSFLIKQLEKALKGFNKNEVKVNVTKKQVSIERNYCTEQVFHGYIVKKEVK